MRREAKENCRRKIHWILELHFKENEWIDKTNENDGNKMLKIIMKLSFEH